MLESRSGSIYVRPGTLEEVFRLIEHIPEFTGSYPAEEYELRLTDTPHLVLLAEWKDHIRNEGSAAEGSLAGFKVGYEIEDGLFYSWMGGVHKRYRRMGVAAMLADAQEKWATESGYHTVRLKTWNRHKGMLCFALLRGFNILSVEPFRRLDDYRIILEKSLRK
ncbi:MAG: GNAT family N-acetyltransferase [Cyclobacteriaceae bacterium]